MGETLLVLLRVAVSLGVVIALIVYVGRRMAAGRAAERTREADVHVVGRQGLGRHSGVAVIVFGRQGIAAGYTVAAQVPDSVLRLDARKGTSVDVLIGDGWSDLYPTAKSPFDQDYTYQMSDHLPLWVMINTDIDGELLDQILAPQRANSDRHDRDGG